MRHLLLRRTKQACFDVQSLFFPSKVNIDFKDLVNL